MKRFFFSLIGISISTFIYAQSESTLCINEIMQSNIDCMMVEHDFPDSWVELYNPTDTDITLTGYYVGTSSDASTAYQISANTVISAKGYLVIYCDKVSDGLHTSFRLESVNAGVLYIFDASKNVVASLTYPAMPAANIAYGRTSDGANEWGWELNPTPGTSNAGGISSILLPDPIFNLNGQVMNSSNTVTITMPEGNYPLDTKIYVTTNGQEPTKTSESATEFTFDISNTTVLRAKLISDSALCNRSVSNSYIFHPRTTEVPIISMLSDSSYIYSDEEGILSKSTTYGGIANYNYDWRRPINAEYLGVEGETAWFNQVGETAVAGDATRGYSQRGMKLYANKRFGTKRYNGVFWEEKPNVDKVKSFVLRNGGNNCHRSRINDALLQRVFGIHIPIDYQAYNPAILYINGEYKGIFGLRERHNEDFVEANYNIDEDDIYYATYISYANSTEGATERTATTFNKVYQLYTSSASTYKQLEALIDVDDFKNHMIAELFSTNIDFPQKNIAMWKMKTGGKWRWILNDVDYCFVDNSNVQFNMFKYLLGDTNVGTLSTTEREYRRSNSSKVQHASKLYKKMMSFTEFKEPFIDAFATYLGDFLKPSVTVPILDKMRNEIDAEMEATCVVYDWDSYTESYPYWMDYLRSSYQIRPKLVYQHMADYFNALAHYNKTDSIGKVIPMTLYPNGKSVTINDISLVKGNFDGAYFSNRTLRLSSGSENFGWIMTTYHYDSDSILVKNDTDTTFCASDIAIVLKDFAPCDSVSFSTFSFSNSEFDDKLEELGITYDALTDWSQQSAISINEPQYAYVNISCDSLPTSKTDDVHAYLDLYDNNGNFFRKKILLNIQGDSEIKHNYSVSFCEDEWIGDETTDVTFGDWVAQDEFHLKGFYNDGLRGTAEVAYQIYGQITQRENCYPRAFPVSLYFNGDFYGIMSWQLKKHRDNMGLAKKVSSNVWLDGTLNDKRIFQDTIDWSKFEVRNPKDLYNMDGTEYDGDNPQEIIDETSSAYNADKGKMVRTAEAKQHIIDLSHYCSELKALEEGGASAEEMQAAFSSRFDVPELVNYKVFSLVTSNYDGFSKNWQWFTYDGVKWTVAPYDCNLTFGYNEDGTSLWPASQSSKKYNYMMQNTDSVGPMLYIKKYFWDEVKARYAELRDNGIISSANLMSHGYDWYDRIGKDNYHEEWAAWPESPCLTYFEESTDRFAGWIADRIALEDKYLGYAPDTISYTLTISDAEWATLCLPFGFEVPDSLKIYTISGIEEDGITFVLDEVEAPVAYEPYLINGPANSYELTGEEVALTEQDDLTNGLLTGTLEDIYAPAGSYVLQRLNNETGFYHVSTDNYMPLKANRAYLTVSEASKLGHFRMPGDSLTGINKIEINNWDTEEMFNFWGQKMDATEEGFYIKRLPDGSYRKVFIKK